MIAWLLDVIPWQAWFAVAVLAVLATISLWGPIWAALPTTVKLALAGLGAGILAYAAGRNRGAAGAVERERARNEQDAKDLLARAAQARERQRAADAGGVPDATPDPFRRD